MSMNRAFVTSVVVAAVVFDFEYLAESALANYPLSASIFLVGFVLNVLAFLPVALICGVPIWRLFRRRGIRSALAFGLAGASVAAATYLLLVAAGLGQSSEHPMTFAENLLRPFHVLRIGFAMLAGSCGASAFVRLASVPSPTQQKNI